jgi:hypothetical protein
VIAEGLDDIGISWQCIDEQGIEAFSPDASLRLIKLIARNDCDGRRGQPILEHHKNGRVIIEYKQLAPS